MLKKCWSLQRVATTGCRLQGPLHSSREDFIAYNLMPFRDVNGVSASRSFQAFALSLLRVYLCLRGFAPTARRSVWHWVKINQRLRAGNRKKGLLLLLATEIKVDNHNSRSGSWRSQNYYPEPPLLRRQLPPSSKKLIKADSKKQWTATEMISISRSNRSVYTAFADKYG